MSLQSFLSPRNQQCLQKVVLLICLENSWEMELIAQPIKWLENQWMSIKINHYDIHVFETFLCFSFFLYFIYLLLIRHQINFHLQVNKPFELPHDKTSKMACAPSEDPDQPGHPLSLIGVFAVRMKKAGVISYPLSAQRRLWWDWADA